MAGFRVTIYIHIIFENKITKPSMSLPDIIKQSMIKKNSRQIYGWYYFL